MISERRQGSLIITTDGMVAGSCEEDYKMERSNLEGPGKSQMMLREVPGIEAVRLPLLSLACLLELVSKESPPVQITITSGRQPLECDPCRRGSS